MTELCKEYEELKAVQARLHLKFGGWYRSLARPLNPRRKMLVINRPFAKRADQRGRRRTYRG